MAVYAAKRVFQMLVSVWGVVTLVFFLGRVTGDPTSQLVGEGATAEQIAQMRRELGLDEPILVQYLSYIRGTLRGDFGESFYEARPAFDVVVEKIPATLDIAVPAFIIGLVIAFGITILVQLTGSRKLQTFFLWVALGREAIPVFWFAWLLILVFSVWLGWLPALGQGSLANLVLPVATLATIQVAVYLRLMASEFRSEYASGHIRTAKAMGISRRRILFEHAMPNAVLPVVTLAGINFAVLLSGTVVTETVFSWPGVGRAMIDAVENSDYAVLQAGVILISTIFVFANFVVDIIVGLLDPRTRVRHD
ncbi:MAG: ABC transporter permease subunit [Propionibacteriales bacterium]|nr:ABC transporter permease subunit [Propionibacteriales bacterium]